MVLGYNERGHCPMLVDGACSIYEHRPRTCRTYDCRVFAAAEVDVARDGKPLIAERAGRWRFRVTDEEERIELEAVRAAARFLRDHGAELPSSAAPANGTDLAVRAVEIRGLFMGGDAPDLAAVVVALNRLT